MTPNRHVASRTNSLSSNCGSPQKIRAATWCGALLLLAAGVCGPLLAANEAPAPPPQAKRVIGPVAQVAETHTKFKYEARVDTGATTTSIHVVDFHVENAGEKMRDNLGKKIRFRLDDGRGGSRWLERKIVEISTIRTSERAETRYKVPLTLTCTGVKKRVLVSLNDRSDMKFPLLLGRNFLAGDFLVDVELGAAPPAAAAAPQASELAQAAR